MQTRRLLATTKRILNQPTAPFHEETVAGEILRLLAQCPHVTVARDSFGNLVARYRRGKKRARWAFAAHMDHPGWVLRPESASQPAPEWEFLGGVPSRYFASNPPRRNFGAFEMWDLPALEIGEGRINSRACDDLIGCAVIVSMFQELERTGAECTCLGLFTRAEEVGFVGAIQLAKSGLVPKTATIISLETSAENPTAIMGQGVIVRVGDRRSIFNPEVTAELLAVADGQKIPFQRCLMSGGTCEATAYALYGYRCGALCVALGNYHNCGPEDRIAPEYVAVSDVRGLATLCTALASRAAAKVSVAAALKASLEKNLAEHRRFF